MEASLFDQPAKKPSAPKPKAKVYTISQLTSLIKTALENTLPSRLTISGQISGFKKHISGHCYFDLKDENAVLPTVVWKSSAAKLKFAPKNGMAVIAKGHIDVYPPHGKYQFIADSLSPEGIGDLQLAFEQMKEKLKAEGLFDDEQKKPLPKYPFRIGVLTSKSGAALSDIADSIHNRWPVAKILFYPVPVQGKTATSQIAKAIKDVNLRNTSLNLDIIIVGRGGGSMEDLWAFNEEPVARAIYNSNIPVISAVGHEVDFTIADLVADARASTPTKAGMLAVPDIKEITAKIDTVSLRLQRDAESTVQLASEKLKTILAAAVFRDPEIIVFNRSQQLDALQNRLSGSAKSFISEFGKKLQNYFERISKIQPARLLADKRIQLNNLAVKIKQKVSKKTAAQEINLNNFTVKINQQLAKIVSTAELSLEKQASKLSACNPKSVLSRGYSITRRTETGSVVKSGEDVNNGDLLITEFKEENLIESKVIKK